MPCDSLCDVTENMNSDIMMIKLNGNDTQPRQNDNLSRIFYGMSPGDS